MSARAMWRPSRADVAHDAAVRRALSPLSPSDRAAVERARDSIGYAIPPDLLVRLTVALKAEGVTP